MKFRILGMCMILTLFVSCTPFTKHLRALDEDYKAGKITASDYHRVKAQLLMGQQQWSATMASVIIASSAQVSATIANQNAINAYNQRTAIMAAPQRVIHTGTINHQVSGNLNVTHRYPIGTTQYLPGY